MAVSTDPNDPNFGLETDQSSPNFGLPVQEAPHQEGGIITNALAGAGDVIKGFAQQFVPDLSLRNLASIAYFPVNAQIQGYHALKSVVDTAEQVQEAEKTEPFSRERFAAGFNVAGQLGLLALGGRAKPSLKEIATGERPIEATPQTPEPPISEIVPPITQEPITEEVIQNAEQIQGPTRPDVDVQLPVRSGEGEVIGGEMPSDVGGEGVPPRGQGEALQQTEEVTPTVPQPEQPAPVPEPPAATTDEPLPKEAAPVETAPVEPTEPVRTGVSSERFTEQYGEDAPVPNTGRSAGQLKEIGVSRLDNFQKTGDVRDDPYSVLTNLREGKVPVSQLADDVSLLRAEHQRLKNDAINAEGTPEWEAKSQASLDMAQAIKEVAHGPASDMMRSFQEYDKPRYDNVTDFDQALRERLNRESTSQERVQFKKMADDVVNTRNGAEEAINGAQKRLSKMPKMNFEDAAKNIHDQITELTKNCII